MVKGIAKYGFKSGVLPQPRRIVPRVKAQFEVEQLKNVRTGFSDPAMVPRGSSANPPGRHYPTAEEKLAHSAKAPTKERNLNTEHQKWTAHSSEIRRRYLADALESESAREIQRAANRQDQHLRAKELRLKMGEVEESRATLLTMPTIEQSLIAGAMVAPRTEEETRELKLKREANRKQTELDQKQRKSALLLELYQASKRFIITEEELDNAVNQAFSVSNAGVPTSQLNLLFTENSMQSRLARDELRKNQEELSRTLLGTTVTNDPGLGEVQDTLQGSWQALLENRRNVVKEESNVPEN